MLQVEMPTLRRRNPLKSSVRATYKDNVLSGFPIRRIVFLTIFGLLSCDAKRTESSAKTPERKPAPGSDVKTTDFADTTQCIELIEAMPNSAGLPKDQTQISADTLKLKGKENDLPPKNSPRPSGSPASEASPRNTVIQMKKKVKELSKMVSDIKTPDKVGEHAHTLATAAKLGVLNKEILDLVTAQFEELRRQLFGMKCGRRKQNLIKKEIAKCKRQVVKKYSEANIKSDDGTQNTNNMKRQRVRNKKTKASKTVQRDIVKDRKAWRKQLWDQRNFKSNVSKKQKMIWDKHHPLERSKAKLTHPKAIADPKFGEKVLNNIFLLSANENEALEKWFETLLEEEVEELGKGDGTLVTKNRDIIMSTPHTQVYYAIKKLSKTQCEMLIDYRTGKEYPVNEQIFVNELEILFGSHKNKHIVNCHSAWHDDEWYYMVLELGVTDFRHVGKLDEDEAKKHGKSLLSALDYLHNKLGYAHCDLKPENIVKDYLGNSKLIDFGQAGELENGQLENATGTPGNIAPELMKLLPGVIHVGRSARVTNDYDCSVLKRGTDVIIKNFVQDSDYGRLWNVMCQQTGIVGIVAEKDLEDTEEIDATYLGTPVDVWNYGFCLWSMLVQPNPEYGNKSNNPFEPATWDESRGEEYKIRGEEGAYGPRFSDQIQRNILGEEVNFDPFQVHAERIKRSNLSKDAIRVLKSCLRYNPAERATIQELLDDRWFQTVNTQSEKLRRRLAKLMRIEL